MIRSRPARDGDVRHYAVWSAAESDTLRTLWGNSLTSISSVLRRSEASCYERARAIGLTSSVPRGCEFISHAAKRVGFDARTLQKMLDANGVKSYFLTTRAQKYGVQHVRYVDSCDVDRCVEKWLATETLAGAARARSCDNKTLALAISQLGVSAAFGTKARPRYKSNDIDAALYAWRNRGVCMTSRKRVAA